MPENNFEKQVQQKMEELKFKPSDEVWQNVAVAITKRKGGRGMFAIVFLLLLLISTVIFIVYDQLSFRQINRPISEQRNPDKKKGNNKVSIGNNSLPVAGTPNAPGNKNSGATGDNINTVKVISVVKETGDQHKIKTVPTPTKLAASGEMITRGNTNTFDPGDPANEIANKKNKPRYKTGQKVNTVIRNSDPADLASETIFSVDTSKMAVGAINPLINESAAGEQVIDSAARGKIDIQGKIMDTLAVIQKTVLEKEVAQKRSKPNGQKSAWKIGLNFSFGVAATQNGFLGIVGSGNGSKSFADPTQTTGGNTGPAANSSYLPSKIKAGTGLVLGVFVQKNISPKTAFLLGLNYNTCNSSMLIGNRVDSSNIFSQNDRNFFYRSGNSKRYKNNFHFLELPLVLRFKLGKQNKLPVYLNTGVSIARLIGSNALQFETMSGSYFRNDALFNKTQVKLSAGLLFSLSRHAGNPFMVGPDINFSLNKMANSGLYKNRHYSYLGIQVQKSVGKN